MPDLFGIGSVIIDTFDGVRKIIDTTFTSKEEEGRALRMLEKLENEALASTYDHLEKITIAQRDVLLAEIRGESWLQRNWRPLLMMVFILVIANNFLIAPYAEALGADGVYLTFPTEFWALMTLGVGGYIGARTYEKAKGLTPTKPPQSIARQSAHTEPQQTAETERTNVRETSEPTIHVTESVSTPVLPPRIGW